MNLSPRKKHLTLAKIRRAIDGMRDVIETEEFDGAAIHKIDAACDAVRAMQSRAVR